MDKIEKRRKHQSSEANIVLQNGGGLCDLSGWPATGDFFLRRLIQKQSKAKSVDIWPNCVNKIKEKIGKKQKQNSAAQFKAGRRRRRRRLSFILHLPPEGHLPIPKNLIPPILKGFSKMHGFATIFFLLWFVPSVLIVHGYQDYDPYNTVRKEEQIYHGRRVRPVADGVLENGGDRAEKALGELRERIEDAEVIEPHGRHRRESLLGLDVPYKASPPTGEQQQNRDGGSIGQQSKVGGNGGARFRENSMAKEQRGKQPKL